MNKPSVIFLASLAAISLRADIGAGIQTAYPLGGGGAIVPRMDLTITSANDSTTPGPAGNISQSATANVFSIGADYDFFPGGRIRRGFYFLGGVGVGFANVSVSANSPDDSNSTSSSQAVVFPEVGVGYLFPVRVGVELLFRPINFSQVNLPIDGGTLSTNLSSNLILSASYRF